MAALAVVLALLLPADALAQSRTYYSADGKVSARSNTGSNRAITFYDASGRVTGRASTSGNTTTTYDASGRRTGSTTTTKPARR
jgi:YD repeat-containing protein